MTARRLSFRVAVVEHTLHRAPLVQDDDDDDTPPRIGVWLIAGAMAWAPLVAWWWLL